MVIWINIVTMSAEKSPTKGKQPRFVSAGTFKAKCLALLDEVEATREPLIVTKRGRAVAQVAPLPETTRRTLLGSVLFDENPFAPASAEWEADG